MHVPPRKKLECMNRVVNRRDHGEMSADTAHRLAVHVVIRSLGLIRLQPLFQEVFCKFMTVSAKTSSHTTQRAVLSSP